MNFKFRITKYLAVSALAVLLLGACSKNNIYMDVAYPNGEENSGGDEGNNDNPDKKDALITFSASVEGRNITRAMCPHGKRTSKLVVCLYSQHIEQYHRRSRCSRQLCHLLPRCTDRKSRI